MIVEIFVESATALLALGSGYRWGSSRSRKHLGPDPVCGCGHHLSLHSLATGQCRDVISRGHTYDNKGNYIGEHNRYCTCQQYVGPKPAEMVIAGGDHFARADITILREEDRARTNAEKDH